MRGRKAVGFEVKAATTWRAGHGAALKRLVADGTLSSAHGIYLGSETLKGDILRLWPVAEFFSRLARGEFLAGA